MSAVDPDGHSSAGAGHDHMTAAEAQEKWLREKYPRQVSGHYWPCIREGHPRDCPECRERHLEEAATHEWREEWRA